MPVVITHQKDESKDELGDSPLLNPLLQPLGSRPKPKTVLPKWKRQPLPLRSILQGQTSACTGEKIGSGQNTERVDVIHVKALIESGLLFIQNLRRDPLLLGIQHDTQFRPDFVLARRAFSKR